MSGLKNTVAFIIMVAFGTATRAGGQIPEGWEIVEITSEPSVFDSVPDINDRGQIVFVRTLGPGATDTEIFLYDHGRLTQVTDDEIVDGFPRINNHGEIVWSRDLHGDGNLSIVKWRDGKLEVISDQPFSEKQVDINDAGQMVWAGFLDGTASTAEIFLLDGASVHQITNDQFSNQGPRINKMGQVVWVRCDLSAGSPGTQIMLHDRGSIRQLSNGGIACGGADLNDDLEVVWITAQFGVDLWKDGTTLQITRQGSRPSINDAGTVSLSRWDAIDQVSAVWMFRDGLLTRVTESTLDATPFALNDRGEIVFMIFPSWNIGLFTNPVFRADVDLDGDVDLGDFAIMQNCWSLSPSFGGECSEADLNGDGIVELGDVEMLVELLGGPGQEP